MFVDFLTRNVDPPNCVHYWEWSKQFTKLEKCGSIFFKHASLWLKSQKLQVQHIIRNQGLKQITWELS